MINIRWNFLNDYSVREPKKFNKYLKLYYPNNLPKCTIFPGEDILIPTGLNFPGFLSDFLILSFNHTLPGSDSDIFNKAQSRFNKDEKWPFLHITVTEYMNQTFLHIINLGTREVVFEPGDNLGCIFFVPIISLT